MKRKQKFLIGLTFTVLFSVFMPASELPGYLSMRRPSAIAGERKAQMAERSPLAQSGAKQRLDQDVGKILNRDTDTWHYYVNNLYTYDDAGNMLTSIYQIYDDSTQQWVNHEKSVNTYDPQGNLLSETIFIWDEDTEWVENYMSEYSYDLNGNILEQLNYYNYTDSLELTGRIRYIYTTSGQPEERYNDSWVDSTQTFEESSKGVYSYDSNGNETGYVQYYWYNDDWDPSHRLEMLYDDQNRLTEEINSYWNGSQWSPTNRYTYEYSEGPDPLSRINHYWDSYTTNDWVMSQKDGYFYDTKGNLFRTISYNWDSDWVESWKYESVFDTSYSIEDLILPSWFAMMPRQNPSMLINDGHFDKNGNTWIKTYDTDYSYTEVLSTGIRAVSVTPFRIYPNPVGNVLYVNPGNLLNYRLEIFNLAGRRLMQHTRSGVSELSLGELPRGIYLVRLTPSGQLPQTQRIILK